MTGRPPGAPPPDEREDSTALRMAAILRAHPGFVVFFVLTVLAGLVLGLLLLPESWSVARRLAGGGFSGAGCALIILANRVVG